MHWGGWHPPTRGSGDIGPTINCSPSSKHSDYAEKSHGLAQTDQRVALATRHNPDPGIMGQHLLGTAHQCIQRRRTRTRSRHTQARSKDPHKRLAGPRSSARPRNARCAMSTSDHARANFQTLLCTAADGSLASESTNDTDLLAQGVADLGPARSHVLFRLDESAVRADIAEVIATDETVT